MTEPSYTSDTPDRRHNRSVLNAKRMVALDMLLGAINAGDPALLARTYRVVLGFHRHTYGSTYAVPAAGEVAALATRFDVDNANQTLTRGPVADRIDEFLADPSTGVRRQRPSRSAPPEHRA